MPSARDQERAGAALMRLMALVDRLRAPEGCPWDQKQTPQSVANYLLEEAYEAVEAVQAGSPDEAAGELGDLLFHVVFLAAQYAEAGHFDLTQVIASVEAKMIRRHPHVFGGQRLADAEAVLAQWGRIKAAERGGQAGGLLDSLPRALPELMLAGRLGQRAKRVGFDWPDARAVWQKVREELAELAAAPDDAAAEAELGDLLFALAQWARHRGLDPGQALRGANSRFRARFAAMENLAAQRGQDLAQLDSAAQDELWERAKAQERAGPARPGMAQDN
ncbi:MAG: nucleoside triphosphate pyrophosphohydrolase [Thermodesulfobacteriota bacterium]